MYAKKLQELRLQKGLSQEELSCKTGLTQIQISKQERGEKKNKVGDELLLIADYFNVSLDYLVGRDESQNKGESYLLNNYRNLNDDNRRMLLEMSNFLNARQGFVSTAV